jgi:hypothetical protein
MLGDEREARQAGDAAGVPKSFGRRVADFETAARANRQLAIVLHSQGLREDGDRFAYRALLVDRLVRRLRRRFGAYLFSLFLDGVAGYGYRMQRILLTYALAITLFALAFYVAALGAGSPMPLPDALFTSIISFHGRTFAGPVTLGTVGAWISAVEAITGLVVEGVFIAMLAQRTFGK